MTKLVENMVANIENAERFFTWIKDSGCYDLVLFARFDKDEKELIAREKATDFKNVTNEENKEVCQTFTDLNKASKILHKKYGNISLNTFEIFVEQIRQDYEVLDKINEDISKKQNELKSKDSKEQRSANTDLSTYKKEVSKAINRFAPEGCFIDRNIEYNTIKNTVQDTLRTTDISKMLLRELFIYYFKICTMN